MAEADGLMAVGGDQVVDLVEGFATTVETSGVVVGLFDRQEVPVVTTGIDVIDLTRGMEDTLELSVVMPCLNEAETLAICIEKAFNALHRLGVEGEVVIADNGSTDGSQAIAESLGARVVPVKERGYGSALMGGIAAAYGKYVIIGDADDSYDFSNLGPYLAKLRDGYELVMGNRFKGEFREGAMPPLHRYLGTPVLTGIERLFYRTPIGDVNCGMRGLRRSSVSKMGLRSPGMEFASEMLVKASVHGLRIAEVPTTLSPDGRSRPPHLNTWRDGWRHLRLLLLHSPTWLYLYPGAALTIGSLTAMLWMLLRVATTGAAPNVSGLLITGVLAVIGYQAVAFSILMSKFVVDEGLLPPQGRLSELARRVELESGLRFGLLLVAGGLVGILYALLRDPAGASGGVHMMSIVIPSLTAFALGGQTILSSFFLGLLRMRR